MHVTIQFVVDVEVALILQRHAARGASEAVHMQVLVLDPHKDATERFAEPGRGCFFVGFLSGSGHTMSGGWNGQRVEGLERDRTRFGLAQAPRDSFTPIFNGINAQNEDEAVPGTLFGVPLSVGAGSGSGTTMVAMGLN